MWRTERVLSLMLTLMLMTGAVCEDAVIASQQLSGGETYKTIVLEPSDYCREVSSGATFYYPHTVEVRNTYKNAKFVEYKVKRNAYVEAGDPLCEFEVEIDEVALLTAQHALETAREAYEKGLKERQEAIDEKAREVSEDDFARRRNALELQRMRLELEQYTYEQTYSMEQQQASIDELIETRETNILCAPVSGTVEEIAYIRAGDSVGVGTMLVKLAPETDMLLRIDNENGAFQYGMTVTISGRISGDKVTLTGRVVASDTAAPQTERNGYAFVQVEPHEGELSDVGLRVTGKVDVLEGVLMLSKDEVNLSDGTAYVMLLDGDTVRNRYINAVTLRQMQYWVLQGLSQGDLIIQN